MMEIWYQLVDAALPFVWCQHTFMKNALLAVLLVAPIFGILGTMVIANRMAFFSDAIGHSALTGIGIGVICGIGNPLWAMMAFALLFAITITLVQEAHTASTDTIIGVFTSTSVALGIVILSRQGGFGKYAAFLVGDLLSITPAEIYLLLGVLVAVIGLWLVCFNQLLLLSINPSLARSRGIHTRTITILFTSAIAVIVTMAIQWVGLLIINSLLVLPAAAARNLAGNVRQYHALSVAISLISAIAGLICSYYWSTATGATIVLVAAIIYFATLSLSKRFH